MYFYSFYEYKNQLHKTKFKILTTTIGKAYNSGPSNKNYSNYINHCYDKRAKQNVYTIKNIINGIWSNVNLEIKWKKTKHNIDFKSYREKNINERMAENYSKAE